MENSAAAKLKHKVAPTHSHRSDPVRYLALSSFACERPTGSTRKRELEERLRDQYGIEMIESIRLRKPRTAPKKHVAVESVPACIAAIQTLSEKSHLLKDSAIDVIVIDQEAELPAGLLSPTCQHLKNLLVSGIDVGIFFADSSLILFKEISKLTTTDDFIRIYLKDIWIPQNTNPKSKKKKISRNQQTKQGRQCEIY